MLDRLGLPGTIFVPTAWVDRGGPMAWPDFDRYLATEHAHELAPLSWEALASLADRGWEIGSHTRSHARLTDLDGGALADELAGSRADCEERLGRPCTSVAYPYGAVDRRVVEAAGRAGYRAGAGLPRALHRPRPLDWPRIGVFQGDSFDRFQKKTSRVRRWAIGRLEP